MPTTQGPTVLPQPLRFLFLTSDRYPPFRVDVDVLFAKELRSRGHYIHWVMQSEAALEKARVEEWEGDQVSLGPMDDGTRFVNRLRKHLQGIVNDFRIFGLVHRETFDFVQVKDKFLGAIMGILAARSAGIPFIFWLSYPFPEASLFAAKVGTARYPLLYRIRGTFFKFVLYRIIVRHAVHIFVQSDQMKRDMISAGVPEQLMTPVLMGIESPESAPIPRIPGQATQLVYLGTLLKTRRLDFLVRVLAIVRESEPNATLLMIGPEELPGDMAVLEAEARRLGVEDAVTLTGRMPRDEAFALVKDAAVCLSPFFPTPILNSTSPTKLIEYMSLGKAVVANDHPEQRVTIEESGAGFCVPYDEAEFARAALKLIADPEASARMGMAGYEHVMATRTYDTIAAELEQSYRSILAEPG